MLRLNDRTVGWVAEADSAALVTFERSSVAGKGFISLVRGRITSRPGMRNHPILRRRIMHRGTDIAAPAGSPIHAAASGTVTVAGRLGGYGNVVYLRHPNGRETRYAHMSRVLVRVGQAVAQGQVIGKVGCTGRCTGPHLHYELR